MREVHVERLSHLTKAEAVSRSVRVGKEPERQNVVVGRVAASAKASGFTPREAGRRREPRGTSEDVRQRPTIESARSVSARHCEPHQQSTFPGHMIHRQGKVKRGDGMGTHRICHLVNLVVMKKVKLNRFVEHETYRTAPTCRGRYCSRLSALRCPINTFMMRPRVHASEQHRWIALRIP